MYSGLRQKDRRISQTGWSSGLSDGGFTPSKQFHHFQVSTQEIFIQVEKRDGRLGLIVGDFQKLLYSAMTRWM